MPPFSAANSTLASTATAKATMAQNKRKVYVIGVGMTKAVNA